MTTSIVEQTPSTFKPVAGTYRFFRIVLFEVLRTLRGGRLIIEDAVGRSEFGSHCSGDDALSATVVITDPRAYRHLALGADVGAAEAYMEGYWRCDDLVSLFRLFTRNVAITSQLGGLPAWAAKLRYRWDHWLRKNTQQGSRRNIYEHYDVGNEFFALFLDETMTYSCGIFETPESTMRDASIAKIDRICRKLELRPSDHLLEIGTGWGSLAIHAARHYGCRVTTTTISEAQYTLARQRIRDAGLSDQINLLCRDYRELTDTYDKIVSVEMIEAVGHDYYDQFFRICSERLTPEGMFLLQAITMVDQRYEQARRDVDVIRYFIFPGSVIPSTTAMLTSISRATDMRLFHYEDITPHYAKTLFHWRQQFWHNIDALRRLGYDQQFIRLWDLYLALCQAAFAERYIGDVQMLLTKPKCQRASIVPPIERPQ